MDCKEFQNTISSCSQCLQTELTTTNFGSKSFSFLCVEHKNCKIKPTCGHRTQVLNSFTKCSFLKMLQKNFAVCDEKYMLWWKVHVVMTTLKSLNCCASSLASFRDRHLFLWKNSGLLLYYIRLNLKITLQWKRLWKFVNFWTNFDGIKTELWTTKCLHFSFSITDYCIVTSKF